MKRLLIFSFLFCSMTHAQYSRDSIYADVVLYKQRTEFDKYLREKTIAGAFEKPLNSETEDYYREACWAVSQYILQSPLIEKGLSTLFNGYASLEASTKRALLEAAYASYPGAFRKEITALLRLEKIPRLFAMQAAYLYRADHSANAITILRQQLKQQFGGYDTLAVLKELDHYLLQHEKLMHEKTPSLAELFAHQLTIGQKVIYSFQRWDRDYPGLAIVQNADGRFCRDATGKLLVFRQLARSSSDLPYFITNGSTPQGIYSIQGTAISHNNLIGPTPNIQLVMPFEADTVYWHNAIDSTSEALGNYSRLLPPSWRSYEPMTEAFYAGKIGRTEIIAHGTTIDPDYFKGKPYYPLTPTMGCLCAPENWNIFNGKFNSSEQFNLVSAFLSTSGNTGYLMVINMDNQQRPVGREEIEQWVNGFERGR
jgi:hypothetical protein